MGAQNWKVNTYIMCNTYFTFERIHTVGPIVLFLLCLRLMFSKCVSSSSDGDSLSCPFDIMMTCSMVLFKATLSNMLSRSL